MRTLLVVGLLWGILISCSIQPTEAQESRADQHRKGLQVSLVSDKRPYRSNDEIKLQAILTNTSDNDLFVYGTLEWGYHASFVLNVRDGNGKEVDSRFIADAVTYPPEPGDKSGFVKLLPYHIFGTVFSSSLRDLNIQKLGKYSLFVEYHSPISDANVDLKRFFGSENGSITSRAIRIEVVR